MKELFPKEIIDYTSDVHQFEHHTRSKVIYGIVLITIIISLIALPFVKVEIYTTARGMLKPSKERIKITPLQSGKVVFANMTDNQKVNQGDTLLMINAGLVNKKMEQLTLQIEENKQFITDCQYLINTEKLRIANIQSVQYQKEYAYYTQKLHELRTIFEKTRVDYVRNKKLFNKKVIAKIKYEESAYEYRLALNTIKQYKEQQKNNWQTNVTEYKNKIRELEGIVTELEQNQKQLVIKAPISGVLKNVKGIEIGSLILGRESVSEISPDTGLIAECYLTPSDIGLISDQKPVNFQIDAFNYNQWGLATGKITAISKDIDMVNNQAVFKVRCSLDQKQLQLKNGFEGSLNKGMTLSARFQLTERTLYDLLYDKVDDWFNPSSPTIAQVP